MSETKSRFVGGLTEVAKTAALVLVMALIPRVVLCQPYTIPSESMEPTLQVGDYIVVSKYAYGWSRHSAPFSPPLFKGRLFAKAPQRGDVVVFKEPRDGHADIIKRLVGLPGDRLQMVQGVLQLNGRPVERQAVSAAVETSPFGDAVKVAQFKETLPNGRSYVTKSWGPDTAGANTDVYVVPDGCYFMMGDNRDDSADSRFDPGEIPDGQAKCPWDHTLDHIAPGEYGMGYVPFEDLVGRAEMVLVSWRPDASLLKPWTLLGGVRWERSFHRLGAKAS
jgi:signal peptidase I